MEFINYILYFLILVSIAMGFYVMYLFIMTNDAPSLIGTEHNIHKYIDNI